MDKEQENRVIEQRRVDDVIDVINYKAQDLFSRSGELKDSVIELRKGFFDDVTINLDESDDAIETEASIKQQAELLSERERSHSLMDKQIKILKDLKQSPYFGRIDFLEDGEKAEEPIYVGLASLMDKEEDDFLIYDWRAPISSLYYDYSVGDAKYETDYGAITGEITLKRQYIIKSGKIEGMFEAGVTIGDHLLQHALGNNASSTMKSIVATIQAEQNKIIRNENSKYLVVQGAAGSGKTSAALQRVAYLMYRHRKVLNEDNMLLFSPNPLFNSYVSNVLPELGEANMRQTTFMKYLAQQIGSELQLESPFSQMEYILTAPKNDEYEYKTASINLKSRLEFKEIIDEYLVSLSESGIVFKDIVFRHEIIISKEEISAYFYDLASEMTLANAISEVSTKVLKNLSAFAKEEMHEDWVMEKVELLDREEFLRASKYAEDREEEEDFFNSSDEETFLLEEIINNAIAPLEDEIKDFNFVDFLSTYKKIFSDFDLEESPIAWDDICAVSMNDFDKDNFPWEDATPYAYFKVKLTGNTTDRSVRYLFVDEAQDYTAFQLAYLIQIFPYTRMTFLGDINQAIYAHTKEGNPLQAEFKESYERIVLTKSYRSTKQIVKFTRNFSPSDDPIDAFEREGHKPKLIHVNNEEDLTNQMVERLTDLQTEGQETIAIICKTIEESNAIYEQLKDKIVLHRIHEQSMTFEKGILVLPIYLAKGIEFDAVIIPDASEDHFNTELDQALFYTACTRAMHDLVMFTEAEPNKYIENAPEDKYDIIK